jgi:hypothetical protein
MSGGSSERGDFKPMDPVYFETRFRTSQPVTDWPSEFVILSAFATTGNHGHRIKMSAPTTALHRSCGCEVAGSCASSATPLSGHAEPSWAVDLPLDEGCNIGQRFLQDAIYHIKND